MKIKLIILTIALSLGFNCAFATEVAYVDVQKVVEASKRVQALKKEQQLKTKELMNFVEKARKDVASVSDTKKKQALEEKYNKELNVRKEKMEKDYSAKLKSIETFIAGVVEQQAKAKGFDMVITKNIVIYGGVDITNDVIKLLR